MKIQDARTIVLEAVARGWIGPEDVWTVACRWALQGNKLSARDLFARVLDTGQLKTLATMRASAPTEADDREPPEPTSTSLHALPGQVVGPRYTMREQLGSGGMGDVVAALDREIRRVVALKTLQPTRTDPAVAARFVEEARITAQLEHPNIVPIYDLGAAPDGQPYYTMRVVSRRSLRDVLARPSLRGQWSLVRLLNVLLQILRALAYAHSRGVIHRDIKPENILLGDFGEVYVADWGLAELQSNATVKIHSEGSAPPPGATHAAGTPGYMSPEVIRGDWQVVDHRIDLFAVGVILYEILTRRMPFEGRAANEVFLATISKPPQPPRELAPGTPLLLEDLCLQLLAKDPRERPESADEVARLIEEFLEGAKEKERRKQEARALCDRALEPVTRYEKLEEEQKRLAAEAEALRKGIRSWEAVEKKRPAWALEDMAERAEKEAALVLAEAIELYTKALGYDAECLEAHQGLADLYWRRARTAEEARRAATQVYYEALVTEHDMGKYAALLRADAVLALRSNPSGAHVVAQRFFERDRVLVPSDERYLGRTPIREARLEPGSYMLTIKCGGYRDVRYPVHLPRGARHDGVVTLYTDDEIGEGFVFVPGGTATLGGDAEAYNALPRQDVEVPDFAIARFPVTMREYCAFLDELDPAAARRRAPHNESEGMYVLPGPSGRWEPSPIIIEGDARKLFPPEEGNLWNVPAFLVDWFDAVAFCKWLGSKAGADIRLPTEVEWEKAARGVDGRFYPWGDRFDPTFCLMRESRPFVHQPEPIGTFPTDESPYGVRDMAGGFREWSADIFGERSADELSREPEPHEATARGDSTMRRARSGIWNGDSKWARAASRTSAYALTRATGLGFRVAKTLSRAKRDSKKP
jgi:serine/threonine-protein kinase